MKKVSRLVQVKASEMTPLERRLYLDERERRLRLRFLIGAGVLPRPDDRQDDNDLGLQQ